MSYIMRISTIIWAVWCVSETSCQKRKTAVPQPLLSLSPSMKVCCNVRSSSTDLFSCVNQSVTARNVEILSDLYTGGGPSLSVGVVSYATDNIRDYTAFSFAVNAAYADHNRYVLRLLDGSSSSFDAGDSRWNKVKILETALHPRTGWARDLDYLLWVDADLIFLDFGLRLEKVAAKYPHAHILASAG